MFFLDFADRQNDKEMDNTFIYYVYFIVHNKLTSVDQGVRKPFFEL